jgi:hypothetical protein
MHPARVHHARVLRRPSPWLDAYARCNIRAMTTAHDEDAARRAPLGGRDLPVGVEPFVIENTVTSGDRGLEGRAENA